MRTRGRVSAAASVASAAAASVLSIDGEHQQPVKPSSRSRTFARGRPRRWRQLSLIGEAPGVGLPLTRVRAAVGVAPALPRWSDGELG